jgi:hypothetical protein
VFPNIELPHMGYALSAYIADHLFCGRVCFSKVDVMSDASPPTVSLFLIALNVECKMSSQVRDQDKPG